MKKLALTIAVVLGLGLTSFAQGGLFQRGEAEYMYFNRTDTPALPGLPGDHGLYGNQDSTPLGSGVVMLLGLGAAYLVGKKRNEE